MDAVKWCKECGHWNQTECGCRPYSVTFEQAHSVAAGENCAPLTGSVPSQPRALRGLEKLCRLYGRMKCGDVMMVWDYANEQAVRESLMPEGSEAWRQSERAKYQQYKAALSQAPNVRITD